MTGENDNALDGSRPFVHGMGGEELRAFCAETGMPAYRSAQIRHWLYNGLAADWDTMRNMPRALRHRLNASLDITPVALLRQGEDGRETARKLLFGLRDGERIEAALLPAGRRLTVCVSTQVGCRFHCAFCASGQAGFVRNLAAGEIVGQVVAAARFRGGRPDNIVFMGIGEPLDNYEALLKSIRILNEPDGLHIGARRMTVSTCGMIAGIRRLAAEGLQVELSVSLHAADDALRSRLMPVNRKYPLPRLIETCREYTARTNRIITFEYVLIRDVNDSGPDAARLADLLGALPCRVNLIPLSPVAEFEGRASPPSAAGEFTRVLARRGINATLRRSRGCAVDAACGQLRIQSGD